MGNKQTSSMNMRVLHRYLGFFLAGIMAVYALSGIVLIFRNTDFLKQEKVVTKKIEANVPSEELGKHLKIKRFEVKKEDEKMVYFAQGTYHKASGEAKITEKKLPFLLDKMTKLHKANTNSPLFWLNIIFGFSLLFFVISAFFMFRPASSIFKKGLYFTLGGIVLTLILLFM